MSRSNYNDAKKADRCHFCPTQHDLEEHHIVPQRFGGSDKQENLVVVCSRCHDKLERLYDKRFYEHFGINDESGERLSHRPCELGECGTRATRRMKTMDGTPGLLMCDECAERYVERSQYDAMDEATMSVVGE